MMKPENILRSDLLDILFEHRNKEYGAYALRKGYNGRLLKAMSSVPLLMLLLFGINAWINNQGNIDQNRQPVVSDYILDRIEPPVPELPKPPAEKRKPTAVINTSPPVIVPDHVKTEPLPDIEKLKEENALMGTQNIQGDPPGETSSPLGEPGGKSEAVDEKRKEDDNKPLRIAEKMPEYPGGLPALRRFLERNLRVPEDIMQPGEQVKVPVQFIVDKNGTLSDIVFLVQADEAFKKEILRVMNKMPKWTPGIQNGRIVPVYYTIPIIFSVSE